MVPAGLRRDASSALSVREGKQGFCRRPLAAATRRLSPCVPHDEERGPARINGLKEGALIVSSLIELERSERPEDDLRTLEAICEAIERARGYDEAAARRELIAAAKEWLDELEREAHDELEA